MKQIAARRVVLLMFAAISAGIMGWHAHKWYVRHYGDHSQRRVVLKGYEFTSPLLDVELPEGVDIKSEPQPFKYKIEELINEKIKKQQAKSVSVYFRDLHDGPWFAINKRKEFNPASMMKIAVMIAWLKRAETDRGILKRRLTYEKSGNAVPEQYTKPALTVTSGKSYSVDELLHYMMKYSDNRATSLLIKPLGQNEVEDVMENMDVNYNPNEEGNSITAHGFSGFFRILYNASYLSREMSEKALQLLSMQEFPLGLSAGVPKGIKVAAKFGEVVPENKNQDIQLHEFGIVYHPKSPYIVGVITVGRDFAAQAAIIRDVSKMIYSNVDVSTMD